MKPPVMIDQAPVPVVGVLPPRPAVVPLVQVGAVQLSVPVTVEVVEASPVQTAVALASAGGGGALSWATRTDQQPAKLQVLVRSAYSWKVQTVWSSLGSTSVNE